MLKRDFAEPLGMRALTTDELAETTPRVGWEP
jgi:hypothetical protein